MLPFHGPGFRGRFRAGSGPKPVPEARPAVAQPKVWQPLSMSADTSPWILNAQDLQSPLSSGCFLVHAVYLSRATVLAGLPVVL